jgi:hypothetical protein
METLRSRKILVGTYNYTLQKQKQNIVTATSGRGLEKLRVKPDINDINYKL